MNSRAHLMECKERFIELNANSDETFESGKKNSDK